MPVGAIMGVATVGSAAIGANAAKSAAKSSAQGATAAADAQLQATRETIQRQEQAATEGRAYVAPYLAPGYDAYKLMQGATGVDPTQVAPYNTAYDDSFWNKEAQDSITRANQAAISTNAALGKGGAFNSGKSLRAAQETGNRLALQGRAGHYNALGGIAQTGYDAAVSSGNYGVGAAGASGNALMMGASNLGQIYQQNAANQGNIAFQNANNMSGALGGLATVASNVNWGGVNKGVSNALGGLFRPSTPTVTVGSTAAKIPRRI
jgi:hypothetical protein